MADMRRRHSLKFAKLIADSAILFWEKLIVSRRAFKMKIMNFQYQQFLLIHRLVARKQRRSRLPRKGKWWKDVVARDYPDDEMLQHFRMRKDSFFDIVNKLEEDLKPSANAFMACLDPPKIVGIAIFKLATGVNYSVISKAFGVHKSTVTKCIYRFCKSINKKMLHEQITLPRNIEDLGKSIEGFQLKCHMSPIIGAIGRTHIPITVPKEEHSNYVNSKGWESLILQVVADSSLLFRDITIKHPGSCNGSTIFKDTQIYSMFYSHLPHYLEYIDGAPIRPLLIGDPSFPLLPWLIKGFMGQKTPDQESFNNHLNMGCDVVKQAIKRLKARWRILCKKIDNPCEFVPEIVSACCILHNVLERNNETVPECWYAELEESEETLTQPVDHAIRTYNKAAPIIRDHLKQKLEASYPLQGNCFEIIKNEISDFKHE